MSRIRRAAWICACSALLTGNPVLGFVAGEPQFLGAPPQEIEPAEHLDATGSASEVASDTIWIADWSFDVPGGGCTDAGWSRYDNRILNDGSNYWSVDTSFAGTGGITGYAAVLRKHDLAWPHDGYGNNWDCSIVLRYRGTGSRLSFRFVSDSELAADLVTVEADSLGMSAARVDYGANPKGTPDAYRQVLYSASGYQASGVVSLLALPDFGLPDSTHAAYIRFESDAWYSDEDGGHATTIRAGLVVDQIAVTGGSLTYSEDFECGAPGCLNPNVVLLNTAPAVPFGEWARLVSHPSDNDKCAENVTCAWIWSDPSLPAYMPDMAFGPGGFVVRNWLDDIIVSPWVNLAETPGPLSTVLSFRRFPGNNYNQGRIVQGWRVRARVRLDNTDTPAPGDSIDAVTPWAHVDKFNALSSFAWTTSVNDISAYFPAATSEIQVGFRTGDFQLLAAATPPTTLDPGPGPYLDRVRIGRRIATGPGVQDEFYGEFLAQDAFPSAPTTTCPGGPPTNWAPTTDRFGTCDFSRAADYLHWVYSGGSCASRCDSIQFLVTDLRGAGITGVYLYGAIVAGPHAGKAPPPWTVGPSGFFRASAARGTSCGSPSLAGRWTADLDDEYFRGGDVLHYFLAATDGGGAFATYPPGLAAEPTSVAAAEAALGGLLEVSFLPTIDWDAGYLARIAADPSGKLAPTPDEIANSQQRSCILYVNQTHGVPLSGPANRTAFTYTLDELGYRGLYDVYDMNFWGNTVTNNQLAGRATVEQATGYALIVHDAGAYASHTTLPTGGGVEGFYPQAQYYRDWLARAAQSEAGRATLWLIGNDIAEKTVPPNPLLFGDMGVTFVSASQPTGVNPTVVGQTAFTWENGATTDFAGDSLALTGAGCPVRFVYDGLGSSGTAAVTHRYFSGATPGAGAVVANADPAVGWNSLLMSFAWEDIRDAQGSSPSAPGIGLADSILRAVLPESCQARAQPTDVDDGPGRLPHATRLFQNFPNPFNPVTTIRFDLAHDGQVTLRVYDVAGRRVRTLADEWMAAGGNRRVTWNGCDEAGNRVASGVYWYRLETADSKSTRKLVLVN